MSRRRLDRDFDSHVAVWMHKAPADANSWVAGRAQAEPGIPVIRGAFERAGWRWSPLTPALAVLVFYVVWTASLLFSGHRAQEWVLFGREFVSRAHAAELMHVDPGASYVEPNFGNDGQFYYYMAVDPVNAQYFMDSAPYRYKRIVYSMLARLLGLGQPGLILYSLIAINVLAAAGGTWAIGAWLCSKGIPAWPACIYGLYPGLLISVKRDLTEPLSYAFVAAAVYFFSKGGKRQWLAAPVFFLLAALTRDKAIAFGGLYAVALLVGTVEWRRPRRVLEQARANFGRFLVFGAIVTGPFLGYQLFLRWWLHSLPSPTSQLGVAATATAIHDFYNPSGVLAIACVYVPAGVCLWMSARSLRRPEWEWQPIITAVTVLFSVVLVSSEYLNDVVGGLMRVNIGVVLMALYCIPSFDRPGGKRRRAWLWICGIAWLSLTPLFLGSGIASFIQAR